LKGESDVPTPSCRCRRLDAERSRRLRSGRTAGNGSLTLISIGAPPRIWPSVYTITVPDSELEHAAQTVVDEAAAAVPDEISVSKLVRVGRPADEIVAAAEEENHDLIVMGARGR
jgi:nucleotide-binding universal stress UspA family protein